MLFVTGGHHVMTELRLVDCKSVCTSGGKRNDSPLLECIPTCQFPDDLSCCSLCQSSACTAVYDRMIHFPRVD